jgi:hypothetical protein
MVSLKSDKDDRKSVQLIGGMLEVDVFPIQPICGTPPPAVTNGRMNYEVLHVVAMDGTKLQEEFNHPSLTHVGFVDIVLDQVPTPQTNCRINEDDLSSPSVILPRRGVLSIE